MNTEHSVIIFTDGACSGNPGPGGWSYICIIPNKNKIHVEEACGHEAETTNNKMEITAVGKALLSVENLDLDVTIFTDSKYVIKGITEWINNWKKNDWIKKDGEKVANEFYWKRICEILEKRKSKINKKIEFKYVPGHSGFVLNDRCDELAVQCSKKEKPDLHSEDLIQFEKRLGFKLDEELKKISSYKKDDSKGTASNSQQYLSLVNGIVKYHSTWADCELRVKGQSNAKFKKCKNQTEVADTLKAWGMQKD